MTDHIEYAETAIAIVGIAGRFPGADDVDALWQRVVAGDDCLTDISLDAARAAGAAEGEVTDPDYVRRSGMLADVAGFDHEFFGIGSRDADVMDPQHRHFLECAWAALEMSTNRPETFDGAIGVFGGCGMNTYLVNNLLTAPGVLENMGWFLLRHTGNDKDFLVNNVAYRLDLHGPAINVQTACSTSLVAVHLAVQSLLSFECDLALAGGATIEVPHGAGYVYHEGEILSPDGHCRAFDAASAGTVLTSGVGVVAVRRLTDAMDAGDPVLAVIKASAINNDGARKVGFLAPSVDGHADVVREALTVADLRADELQLIEAHGTGTAVGDPIEVAALTEAFRSTTAANGFCRLTSTKPNIGHLDTAAGAASLIKVVQALRHRTLPPMANHTAASELVDWERSPFVVSDAPADWPADRPRRAGISSLGVGGTNAHVVVQEAPEPQPTSPSAAEQTLAISAMSEDSLDGAAARLADHLERYPEVEFADVAHTLITGRRPMSRRRVVTATTRDDAIALLRTPDRHRSFTAAVPDESAQLGFMFPGGGSQYRGMGAGLDERFATFHDARRHGVDIVRNLGGPDLSPMFELGDDDDRFRLPTVSLPAVFVTSVALARQWMAFGAQPDVLLGHSLGEYVAAHLSGVIDLEDALSLVVTRSRLMEQVGGPDTAMLVVPLDEAKVVSMLPSSLSLATINAADECVVAGRADDVEAFAEELQAIDAAPIRIPLAAAAHSSLLDPVLDEFRAAVRSVTLSAPQIPYPSNLTGTWITDAQATDPNYWVDHLRGTVRFLDGVRTVCADRPTVLSELGPGHSLSSAARRTEGGPVGVAPALRHPDHDIDDTGFSLQAYARQWALGADIDLNSIPGGDRRRVVLPTYSFERIHHWIEPGERRGVAAAPASDTTATAGTPFDLTRIDHLDDFTWLVDWVDAEPSDAAPSFDRWTVHAANGDAFAAQLVAELSGRGLTVQAVGHGTDVESPDVSTCVITVAPPADPGRASSTEWFSDAAGIARSLGDAAATTRMIAVTRRAFAVDGIAAHPTDSMISGLVRVASREYEALDGRVVDVDDHVDIASLADELVGDGPDVIGFRNGVRRHPVERPATIPSGGTSIPTVRDGGTYLITGAFGGVGFTIAEHLARDRGANLALLSRDAIPTGADRARWVLSHGRDDATSRRLRRLAQLESYGTKIEVVVGDTTDAAALTDAVEEAKRRLGDLDGAVHAAGVMHDRLLALATDDDFARVIAPKVEGATALAEQLVRAGGDLLVLIGSTSALVAPAGQAAYVGANTALDQMAGRHGSLRVVTIDFGLWAVEGMATEAARFARLGLDGWTAFEHPILDSITTANDGSTVLTGRLDPLHHWVVDEHRTDDGTPVLPGTGHLELMYAAATAAGIDGPALHDVLLLEPIVVPDGTTTALRVTVTPAPDQRVTVEQDDGAEWRVCSEARIEPAEPTASHVDSAMPLDVADPLGPQRARLHLGPHWDAVTGARRGDEAAEVSIDLADPSNDAAAWTIHPAVTDLCTTAAVVLAPDRSDDALWVPVRYERVAVRSPLPTAVRATALRRPANDDNVVADIDVRDLDGQLVLEIRGLELHPIGDHHFGTPEPVEHATDRTSSLADLALDHGLRAAEGIELFERIMSGDADRVVASSLRLDDVRQLADDASGGGTGGGAAPITPAEGAASSVESVVTQVWRELLGLDDVGLDEDFFDLGGHSLIAIRLMSRLNRDLGIRLELADLLGSPTIGTLAGRLREVDPGVDARLSVDDDAASTTGGAAATTATSGSTDAAPADVRHLVTISPSGDGRPLYVVHGAGGNVLFLWSLARAMSGKRPIYGFQAHGVDGVNLPDSSIEAMAERYVAELRDHAPGPYLLGGFSGGGLVTLEMARQLHELGDEVELAVLFDSAPTGKMTPGTSERVRNVIGHLRSGSGGSTVPYIKRAIKARLRRFVPEKAERTAEHAQQERALGYADTDTHGYVNLFYYFTAVGNRYEVGTYPVDVLLVKADDVWPSQPYDYHWRPHIDGELTIVTTPGDHHSMFFPEYAPYLADAISPILDLHDGT